MTGQRKKVDLYTDGACLGNPGPGGFGVVLIYGGKRRELAGGFRLTTNNRMEIMACIVGLKALKEPCAVTLYSDSQYVTNTLSKGWARRWRQNGWMRTKTEKALNPDLWEELLNRCDRHDVRVVWVRGHSGHPENERCDALAVAAAKGENLPTDEGYEGDGAQRFTLPS
jgi:ribonuclease HI